MGEEEMPCGSDDALSDNVAMDALVLLAVEENEVDLECCTLFTKPVMVQSIEYLLVCC